MLAKYPPFPYVEFETVTLRGWQRRFHLADPMNRGESNKPGLTLGLEESGTCEGLAYLISDNDMQEGLKAVWKQEMLLPFYKPTWIIQENRPLLTMVTDLDSPAFCGPLPVENVAQVIQVANGIAGSNRAYLTDVRDAFGEHGIEDDYLDAVWRILT